MATKTFTNMKDLQKAMIEEGIKKVKKVVEEFTESWKQNNANYQQYPCFGVIANNYDKIIDVDTKITSGGAEMLFRISDFNDFAPVYSIEDDAMSRNIYENFGNDFEIYCRENNIPIKRA